MAGEVQRERLPEIELSLVRYLEEFLPVDVLQFFRGRGAYARFKDLLGGRGMLDQWYDFEAKAVERALKTWCDLNSIEVSN